MASFPPYTLLITFLGFLLAYSDWKQIRVLNVPYALATYCFSLSILNWNKREFMNLALLSFFSFLSRRNHPKPFGFPCE